MTEVVLIMVPWRKVYTREVETNHGNVSRSHLWKMQLEIPATNNLHDIHHVDESLIQVMNLFVKEKQSKSTSLNEIVTSVLIH